MNSIFDIEVVKNFSYDVEGWLTDKEGELLYNLAKNCKGNGVIVEIGSWQGKSTIFLGAGSKAGKKVKVYSIDPHTGLIKTNQVIKNLSNYKNFIKNINEMDLQDIVKPIIMTSKKASSILNEPIELIFIDGLHDYDSVRLDFELWYPKVIFGGVMVFHDTIAYEGPKKLVLESIFLSRNFKNYGLCDTTTHAQKTKKNLLLDRIMGKIILILKIIIGIRFNLSKSIKCIIKSI